jgi:glucose-6-phosphate 1-dehydrogenase
VLAGDPTLSVRGDQAVETWRIVEPVLRAWRDDTVPLQEYEAGSDGPGTPLKPGFPGLLGQSGAYDNPYPDR